MVKDGTASHTARSVAAHRLEYTRVAADYGDPAADQSLTADVAAGQPAAPGRMHEYLRKRTAFFDRAVTDSIASGVRQVVIGGAGYDGRALRYAKPGVRWFEVDHPATQADKRERLGRLAIDTGHIEFIPADFITDPIAEPLTGAGLDPDRPALFLFEGVVVYLEPIVVARVLTEFAAVARAGGSLAISVSTVSSTSESRARFREWVAAHGEPARSELSYDETRDLLAAAGWQLRDGAERQQTLGLLIADAASRQVYG
ncbi:MAG: class I SAM-dependent methyltransferase [Trebonia sp.]|jgi:methyltransferase (TIGR00027 family)